MAYYLAYGSNLTLKAMKHRAPNSRIVGIGWLPDHKLAFCGQPGISYLDVIQSKGSQVPVGCFQVDKKDIQRLDEYEDYPDLYDRKTIRLEITKPNGQQVLLDCFYYKMVGTPVLAKPSAAYFEDCMEGYRDFGFDPSILEQALKEASEA